MDSVLICSLKENNQKHKFHKFPHTCWRYFKIIQYKAKLLVLIKITTYFQVIYITNLFQMIYVTASRVSSRKHSKKFTSLIIPKNFLIKREDRIIKSHSEPVNSWKRMPEENVIWHWQNTRFNQERLTAEWISITKQGRNW